MVTTPQDLSARERELLSELASLRNIDLGASPKIPEVTTREKLELIEGE
jgi:hypothetical protein